MSKTPFSNDSKKIKQGTMHLEKIVRKCRVPFVLSHKNLFLSQKSPQELQGQVPVAGTSLVDGTLPLPAEPKCFRILAVSVPHAHYLVANLWVP